MFSERTSWSFAPNRLSRLLEEKKTSKEVILDLTESNPTRAELEYPEDEILASLQNRRALLYEPNPCGLETAREAVARYYAARGRKAAREELLLTASTSEAYAFLFKLLMDPADQVLIPRPSYPLFDYLAALESLEVVSYPLVYDGSWSPDTASLEGSVSARTRAVLMVHPGNPTGSYLKRGELDRLLEICRRHQLALIVDEVFFDYDLEPNPESAGSLVGEQTVLTFVLSGLSKIAGLPQMKLSWIWMGGPELPKHEARLRLEHVSDVFLSVGTPVQHGLEHLLELAEKIQPVISSRLAANYAFLRKAAIGTPVGIPNVEGGWYAVLRLPSILSSEQWAWELLFSDHVYVHPGYLFDFSTEAYLVVSLLTVPSTFQDGIQLLVERVKANSRGKGIEEEKE